MRRRLSLRTLATVALIATTAVSTAGFDPMCQALIAELAADQAKLTTLENSGPSANTCTHAPEVCEKHNKAIANLQNTITALQPRVAQCQQLAGNDATCRTQLSALLAQLSALEQPSGPTADKCQYDRLRCQQIAAQRGKALATWHKTNDRTLAQHRDACGSDFSALGNDSAGPQQMLQISVNGVDSIVNPPSYVNVADPNGFGVATACNNTALHDIDASQIANGSYQKTEWRPLLDEGRELSTVNSVSETDVGLAGTLIDPQESGNDVAWTHPFGERDWEFKVAPDAPYVSLLASSNSGPDGEFKSGTTAARALGLVAPGVLGVETDREAIPPEYRIPHGARVAIFGRWIVDCGHNDFHTEVHPPLLTTAAVSRGQDVTVSELIGRPYLATQMFSPRGDDFVSEIKTQAIPEMAGCQFVPYCILKVDLNENVERPFLGIKTLQYVIRPPTGRKWPGDLLMVREHLTVRTGVSVQLVPRADGVGVVVTMDNSKYQFPTLAPYHRSADFIGDSSNYDVIIAVVNVFKQVPQAHIIPLNTPVAIHLNYDQFDLPQMRGYRKWDLATFQATQLPQSLDVVVNDAQPWPVFGRIDVYWVRKPMMARLH